MGPTIQFESNLPGYSMRDLSEDSNSCGWPLFHGDKTLSNGQYYNGFLPRAMAESHSGYEKDLLKRTMLKHEAIFKNQVYELHRLYRIQRNMMDEIKQKGLNENRHHVDALLSSGAIESQAASQNASKCHKPSFLVGNSVCGRPSISGSSSQACAIPSQIGVNSKNVEVLEDRPVKVCRKMIDLHLPADEYIDTEETGETQDDAKSLPSGNRKYDDKNGEKLFLEGVKASHWRDSLVSCLGLRNSNGFADLNESVQCQESEPVGSSKPLYGKNDGHVHEPWLEENKGQNGWQLFGAGRDNSIKKSVSQTCQPDKFHLSSQYSQALSNDALEPLGYLSADQKKINFSIETTFHDMGLNARNLEVIHDSRVESSVASNNPSLHNRPGFVGPWSNLLSSWENPHCSLSQKSVSVQAQPFFNSFKTLNCSTHARAPRQELYGDRWLPESNSRANPTYESRYPDRNGFCHGSSSGSRETLFNFPSISFNGGDNSAANDEKKFYGSANANKDLNSLDMKFTRNMGVNAALAQQSLESVQERRKHEEHLAPFAWLKGKSACKNEITNGHLDLNASDLSIVNPSLNQFAGKTDSGRGLNHISRPCLSSVSCANNVDTSGIGISDSQSNRKILGVPIFTNPSILKEDNSSLTYPPKCTACRSKGENKVTCRELDINLPCDPAISLSDEHSEEVSVVKRETDKQVAGFRHHIDLNLCASRDGDSFMPSPRAVNKVTPWIDLEAPAAAETAEDDVCEEKCSEKAKEDSLGLPNNGEGNLMIELIKSAAEAIVSISSNSRHSHFDEAASSSAEASMNDPLRWFAEILDSCGNHLDRKMDSSSEGKNKKDLHEERASEEIDYFEHMTLRLPETKEEDYMPEPLVPEKLKFEETGPTLIPNRPRRGPARRARQRRDFQRDILPGLASLSRHEVTEDLQTFGGLMRAMGYSWNLGLTRRNSNRNGSNRGRRKLINNNTPQACPNPTHQVNNSIEVVGVEDRSLAGWGTTARRPRRQRCPTGNPQTVLLT